MIKGSHNSMSYLKPQWWARPFTRMFKCQDKDIHTQYKEGVRCFDLHVKFEYSNTPCFCNGIITYDSVSVWDVLKYLDSKGDAYVILTHDDYVETWDEEFFDFCDFSDCVISHCPNLRISCCNSSGMQIRSYKWDTKVFRAHMKPHTIGEYLQGPRKLLPIQEENLEILGEYNGIVLQDFV